MKKLTSAALAALALAAILPTSALADDPVSPKQGAVCNLYWTDWSGCKGFIELTGKLATMPAAATFVDNVGDFVNKKDGVSSNLGMWTGWLKQEKAGTYTFLCKQDYNQYNNYHYYSIWINGNKCVEGGRGQVSFNVDLSAGFNSVKIVAAFGGGNKSPLTLTYKKAGSLKEPVSFGPENMYYDDEE